MIDGFSDQKFNKLKNAIVRYFVECIEDLGA